ncbi:MAG: diguanylate cyclase [Oscillospiraceae bacterium]|nr:diguanylate cyclase [Oscillospiraceae bacterium]
MEDLKKNSILIVDDENSNIMALTHILGSEYMIYAAKTGEKALEAAEKHKPDVILLDIIMPEMDGYALIASLKSSSITQDIPVIFISGLSNFEDEEKGLALGAADYISKPFIPGIVKLRIANQIKIINQLRTIELLSLVDQLTSIPNRRGFDNRFSLEWIRAIREGTFISILMIDVDMFKLYNDTYGHQQGDVVLQIIAKTISQSLNRPGDFAARWGGEEFAVLLPSTNHAGALHIAEIIRKNVEGETILCADGTPTQITVSVGTNTVVPQRNEPSDIFVNGADKALYLAKQTGRNKVCSANEDGKQ